MVWETVLPPRRGGSMRNLDVLGDEIYKFSDFEVLPPRRGGSRGGTFWGLGWYWGVVMFPFEKAGCEALPWY